MRRMLDPRLRIAAMLRLLPEKELLAIERSIMNLLPAKSISRTSSRKT